jgi:hypothetical protein
MNWILRKICVMYYESFVRSFQSWVDDKYGIKIDYNLFIRRGLKRMMYEFVEDVKKGDRP